MIPIECIDVTDHDVRRVSEEEAAQLYARIEQLASARGDLVTIVPPQRGGWAVRVGTLDTTQQADLPTAIGVAALRLGLTDTVRAERCQCGAVRYLELGRLRCRRCDVSVGMSEEGGDG